MSPRVSTSHGVGSTEIVGESAPLLTDRRTLLVGAAATTVGAVATSLLGGSVADAASPQSIFEPITPSLRLAETRLDFNPRGFTRVNPNTIRVAVAGRTVDGVTIPSDAVAAVLTVVGINRVDERSHLTAYPSRTTVPRASTLNLNGFLDLANNLVTVKLGSDGAVEFHTPKLTSLVVDIVGVYRPAGGRTREGRFEPLGGLGGSGPSAKRVFSPQVNGATRDDQVVDIDLQSLIDSGLIEADAQAVVANLTVARPPNRGHLSAYPFGEPQPSTSSLNYPANSIRAANSIVRLGTNPRTGRRGFHIYVKRGARLFVDITGFFTGPNAQFNTTSGQFVAVTPQRVLETRSATPSMRGVGGGKRLWGGWSRTFTMPSSIRSSAGAVAVNLTMVNAMRAGYLTLLPALTPRQQTSNVNAYYEGQTTANHAVTPVSTSGLNVFASHGSSVVCDLVGYYVGTPARTTVAPVADPPPQPAAPPYAMSVPRMGTVHSVRADSSSNRVVNSGHIWHWTGTGMVGQGASIGTFGHRTDAGGPFRRLDWLRAGDRVVIDTTDQRRYTYEFSGRELTDSRDSKILEAAFREPGEVLSLIACTVGFDSSKSAYPNAWAPTSLKYRIVVRLRLIGWEDISPTNF